MTIPHRVRRWRRLTDFPPGLVLVGMAVALPLAALLSLHVGGLL